MLKLTAKNYLPAAAGVALLIVLAFAAPAFADPIAAKKAEAAAVQSQIAGLNTKAEIATEEYNAAKSRYSQLTDKVHATEARIAKLKKRTGVLQSHLSTRASDMYRQGPLNFLSVLLSVRSFEDFDTTIRVLTSLNEQDAKTVSELKVAKSEADTARATLLAAQTEAGHQKTAMAHNAAAVKTQLAKRRQVLAGLTVEIQTLIAQQIAAEKAAEQARAIALLQRQREAAAAASRSVSSSSGYSGIILGGNPPTSSKGAAAVYWAEKQLGKPYVWAATGPNAFDCSGLTMYAYNKVGISLSHYSRAQINEGQRVSRSNLQPGDLVFFGSPIHHVGMYVGGGDFIEAPYTGSHVRITSLSRRGDFAGACRP